MAMTHEEELSKVAADATANALCEASLLALIAHQACARGWSCAPAHVLSEISDNLAILVLLLLPAVLVLFFLRAAGCSSKATDPEILIVKDAEERPSGFSDLSFDLLWFLLLATLMGTISFVLYMYGDPELCQLLGDMALWYMFLCEANVYVHAALSLWRMMKPKPSNIVPAEQRRITHLLRCAGSRAGRSKMMQFLHFTGQLPSSFLAVLNKDTDMHVV